MEYRYLGRTGVKVSPICLGTDPFLEPTPEKECAAIINAAVEAGINVINTGDTYAMGEVEKVIGRTLKESKTRNSVLLMTKCDHAPRTVGVTLDDSLREACDNLVPPGSNVANFHNTAGWMIGQII